MEMDVTGTQVLTAQQMRKLETRAMESGQVTGLELMERAGQGVVNAVFAKWPEYTQTSFGACVLCGPGNNGGDGFVIARILKESGWDIDVFLFGDAERLPPDAKTNHDRWCRLGPVQKLSPNGPSEIQSPALVFDGVFGTGLTRPVEGELATSLKTFSSFGGGRVVAIDLPTGLCADSGKELGTTVHADLTVTFHAPKLGHFLGEGPARSGALAVADIGLKGAEPDRATTPQTAPATLVTRPPKSMLAKATSGHKYGYGHALVLSGPSGRGGAARLAARGALRIGAGLVTIACPSDALAEHAAQLNAIMCRPYGEAAELVEILADDRLNAICLGPGLGTDEAARMVVTACVAAGRSVVLDADALSAYVDDPRSLFQQLHERCVLTPHAGEFKRLFPDIADRLAEPPSAGPAYSKVDATRDAARRAGCTVLYKGADTVIASANGETAINSAHYDREAPWLATAGSGDVLSGFVVGLMARGFDPHDAARLGASLHLDAAIQFGPGLIAEDLPEALPKVFRNLGH